MRLTVIVAQEKQLSTAGVRVRYQRIAQPLEQLGYTLDFKKVDEVRPEQTVPGDYFLFSKCMDLRSIFLADALGKTACHVGVDIFDDYFSQKNDSRILHMRRWFSEILDRIDFVTCATPTMHDRLKAIGVRLPIHTINDPFDAWDQGADMLDQKLAELHRDRVLRIVWFGTGDNQFFPVGLDDLTAFSDRLAQLQRTGLKVHLKILTNKRALTATALARLARLPVKSEIHEWSLEKETQFLRESFAAFIPVNQQPFSSVKSLNRAVTAFTRGAQILTSGYPLYAPFSDFIYTSSAEFLKDIEGLDMKLSSANLDKLKVVLHEKADPVREAKDLTKFLSALPEPENSPRSDRLAAVIHGLNSPKTIMQYAARTKKVSIAANSAQPHRSMDLGVATEDGTGAPVLHFGKSIDQHLSSDAKARVKKIKTSKQVIVDGIYLPDDFRTVDSRQGIVRNIACYGDMMFKLSDIIKEIIPDVTLYLSEMASPYRVSASPHASDFVALNGDTSKVGSND